MKSKFPEDLIDAAKEFLISEFQAPPDKGSEDDYSVFDYRDTLARTAYWILGGIEGGKQNVDIDDDIDDEEGVD